jgi:hypothetical protein
MVTEALVEAGKQQQAQILDQPQMADKENHCLL